MTYSFSRKSLSQNPHPYVQVLNIALSSSQKQLKVKLDLRMSPSQEGERGGFSGAVKLSSSSLNDYIAPSQACIIPLSSDGNTLLVNDGLHDAGEGDGGEILLRAKRGAENKKRFDVAKEDFSKDGKSMIKVSLSDCLACSGCVTSAETVLMEQQSVEEFLGQNFSSEGNIQPVGGTHDRGRGGGGRRRRLVVTLSPQSTASLAVKYSVKYEEMLEKMCGFFKTHFNARAVCSSTEARAASRARYAKEFTERKSKSSGLLPMIASACPGWVCYAEKTENALRDVNLLAKAKSPQAIAGTFAKKGRRAAFSEDTEEEEEEEEEEAYHVSVMPCFDKKLEASRREFKTKREGDVLGQGKDDDVDGVNETDCVLTTTEVVELLEKKCNIVDEAGVRSLPSAKIDSMFASWFRTEDMMDVEEDEQEDALLPPAFAATSGAYLEYVFRKAARDLYGVDLRGKDLEYKTLTNADMREVELKIEGEVKLKFLLAYGFRNVQNVTRALKREPNKWDFVEMMACPSGCANGGGQVPPKQSYLNAKLLKRVEEAYMEGEIESERRNLHSAAVKSLITSAEENGDTLSAYDTTYNALAASNDMKKKVTIANVDNW
ncbi:unnamed protein product [Bathycoccus prasinos]|uniref:Unnamed protein product n=1 Tax=Bathycoccus prasinos TaxID=41875 RepID=K8F3N8_9CHLO|nr:unnamed protein product [Bathycoccus prasinos]CCO66677.1 unnamed protein product [Bathycoccus prasinos]|eukprot:XP_007511117.1 unnamed protein product [Bathycoccus prasinos]